MRAFFGAAVGGITLWCVCSLSPMSMSAQQQRPQGPPRGPVPRVVGGKPDLTGVWQGGSTQRGSWEEANGGVGVGGSGRDPAAPVALSSNDRPAGREGAPYQPWAAKKVLELPSCGQTVWHGARTKTD